jgi:hypothetical protein
LVNRTGNYNMKPELVFPLILASYSEDKIARELLNNDSIIKTAGWFDFLLRPLSLRAIRFGRWLNPDKRRRGSTRESKGESKGGPQPPSGLEQVTGPPSGAGHPSGGSGASASVTSNPTPTAAAPRDKGEQLVDVLQSLANKSDAARDPNAIKEILQTNKLDAGEFKQALPLLQEYIDKRNRIESIRGEPLLQNRVNELIQEQTEISNKLQAMGVNPNTLEKIKTIPPNKLGQVLTDLNAVMNIVQPAEAAKPADAATQAAEAAKPADAATQAAEAAKPADAATQAAEAAKPADAVPSTDTNQAAETKDKNKGSSLLSKIVTAGGLVGTGTLAYNMLSSAEEEKKRERDKSLNYLAETAGNPQKKPPGLNRPGQTQNKQEPPAPKTEINPLLAAGLGALLLGGLAQRRYGNNEGQYNSLNEALLPMLAGGLIGYGGAEAINNNPSV